MRDMSIFSRLPVVLETEEKDSFGPAGSLPSTPFHSSPVLLATLFGEDCVMGQKNVRAEWRLVSSRNVPKAFRDDTKNGCVAD